MLNHVGLPLVSAFIAIACQPLIAASLNDEKTAARVEQLLGRMTLDEKIGQLTQVGGIDFVPGAPKAEDTVRKGLAGSILWLSDPVAINRLQKLAVEQTRLHIPLIFGLDVVHGFRTLFPMPLALAASWDPALIEQVQSVAAKEARAAGITWTFAPMVDIARDPRWGRIIEGAGEDPFLGAAVARAQVRGFQGTDISSPDRLLACAKHFAGYGAADGGRDYDSSYIPESQLWNVYLPPFRAALDAGVGTFMSAYMDLNDVPATANPFLLQDVLRKSWKFQGFVVSDANSVKDLVTHGFARDESDAAYRALTAGVDMDMASGTYLANLGALVKNGRIPVATIDAAVRPILAAKFRLGLFEHPYADESRAKQIVGAPENRAAARVAAQRSAVLLRNENHILPLSRSTSGPIAVIGPLADAKRDMLTMWSGFDIDLTSVVTVLQGIRNTLGSAGRVEYAPGVQLGKQGNSLFDKLFGGPQAKRWTEEQTKAEFDKAIQTAKNAGTIILVLGEQAMMSGEYASQSSLELPARQQQLMEQIVALGKPVVLLLINGRPLDISWASANVPAILEAWHPGTEGGNAIAGLLFGEAAPSGKLPLTWPRSAGQIPIFYAHNRTHQPEGAPGFESRYWNDAGTPLYPFGYGLTYTRFEYSNLRVKDTSVATGAPVRVTVDIANTGDRAGDEVAQLYVHQLAGNASRPVRELKGFQRIALRPSEKKTIEFSVAAEDLRYWSSISKSWIQEPAAFDLWVGGDSTAPLHAQFQVVQ